MADDAVDAVISALARAGGSHYHAACRNEENNP